MADQNGNFKVGRFNKQVQEERHLRECVLNILDYE